MPGYDDSHSRAVAWLKLVLPLLALAILSTLFLFSRTIDPRDAIPFSEVDVEARLREPRLTAPTWAGMTDDGSALTVSAAEARPGQGEGVGPGATSLIAKLQTPDGGRAELVAQRGTLDAHADLLTLEGGVELTTGTGYLLQAEAMTAGLRQTSLISETPVTAQGPIGHLQAGAMELSEDPGTRGRYLLVFKQGVKLLYQPVK